MLNPGTKLGPYEVQAAIGAGGMGEVYKARDTRLDRTVAIKVLPPALAADPQFRERFDREARAISQLTHPHICTLFDVGQQAGAAYLVMEYLEGATLAEHLAGSGPGSAQSPKPKAQSLPIDQALTIAIQIASALDHAHRAGITHRDLKPGNIMLTKSGAKLLDFGLAKVTGPHGVGVAQDFSPAVASRSKDLRYENTALPTVSAPLTGQGTILGTFQYMAPEQIEGLEADARTDIFAFGAELYEMLTGRKAFEGKTQAGLLGAIVEREPPPLSSVQPIVQSALSRIVPTCLAKERNDRW